MKRTGLASLLFLFISHLCIGQSVTVSGAGNAGYGVYSLNQTYTLSGQANGKNQYSGYTSYQANGCYNCSGTININWTGTQWQLAATGAGSCSYCNVPTITHSSTLVTGTNPPCTGWSNGMTLTGACETGSTPTSCPSVSLVVTQVGGQTVNPASTTISIGNSLTLLATGCTGGELLWSTGVSSASVVVSPTVTTNYSVTCTASACTNPASQSTTVDVQLLNLPAPVVGTLPTSVCVGKGFTVPYSTTGVYPAGTIFSVELSDTLGAWTNPTVVGVLLATGSGTINAYLPDGFIRHENYRLRVVSTTSAKADSVGKAIAVVSLCTSVTTTGSTVCHLPMTTIRSGDWHDPATWSCGKVPDYEEDVTIMASHTVTVGANLTAFCQTLKQYGKLVFGQGSTLQLTGDENPAGSVVMRGPAVLKSGLYVIDAGSMDQILWVKGNHVRFRGVPNSVPMSGSPSGGRQAAPMGLIGGSFMVSKPTSKLPAGWFGKATASFTVNGTSGVETEVVFSKAEFSDVFDQLDIAWQAVVKLSAKVEFEGKIAGKVDGPQSLSISREAELAAQGTVTDTIRATFDFGLRVVNNVVESFSVGIGVDNNLRVDLDMKGKIAFKFEKIIYHWQRENPIWKWIPVPGPVFEFPIVFTPRVNIYHVAEAAAEFSFKGQILNSHQHFSVGKRFDANTGWSDYSLPPALHPDGTSSYSIKGTFQWGTKIKAGVFFYWEDERDPLNPLEDGEDEETLDVIVEAVKVFSGECAANQALTVTHFIKVKPELVLKVPILGIALEAKLTVNVPDLFLHPYTIQSVACSPDSNCIANGYPANEFYVLWQIKKNALGQPENQVVATYESTGGYVRQEVNYEYDIQGRMTRFTLPSPGNPSLINEVTYSNQKARIRMFYSNGVQIADESQDHTHYGFANGKITRTYEYYPQYQDPVHGLFYIGDSPYLRTDNSYTYYPNNYLASITDYLDRSGTTYLYSYDEAAGTVRISTMVGPVLIALEIYTYDMSHKAYNISPYSKVYPSVFTPPASPYFINYAIHNGRFYDGRLLKSVQMYDYQANTNESYQYEYTFDSKDKPITVNSSHFYNSSLYSTNGGAINWQPCP